MRKYQINCPLVIKHLPSHERYKDELLSLIEQSDGESLKGANDVDQIARADFFVDSRRLYEPLFMMLIKDLMKELSGEFINLQSTDFQCESVRPWYQQYYQTDAHGWHDHAYNSTLSLIYYLELPRGGPGTEFIDPFSGCVHSPKVKEGDVLVFPSFVRHQSPPNKSDQRKTIISINLY